MTGTTASEPLNGVERFEEASARVREVYLQGVSDLADRVFAEFIMPDDQVAVAEDMALFTVFLMTLKIQELQRGPLDWGPLLRVFRSIDKRLQRELPEQLREIVKAHTAQAGTPS